MSVVIKRETDEVAALSVSGTVVVANSSEEDFQPQISMDPIAHVAFLISAMFRSKNAWKLAVRGPCRIGSGAKLERSI